MKTISKLFAVFLLLFYVSPFIAYGQSKSGQSKDDIIIMQNGERKAGKVISINSDIVKFSYKKETVEYQIRKSEINKIEFASGRTERFENATPSMTTPPHADTINQTDVKPSDNQRKNKIAVLPFEIETNDQGIAASSSMSKQVQEACVNALRSQSPFQTIQDPMITNNILAKKNLIPGDHSLFTPKEWAELLGVEYVIIGTYSIQNKGTSTHGSNSAIYNDKKSYDGKSNTDKTKGAVYGASNSYTSVNYDTHINIGVYNESGEQLFSDSRSPAFGGLDSYKAALKIIMKRSPFGKK